MVAILNSEPPKSYYVLVWNLPIEHDEYSIGEGLLLRKIPLKITVFDLATAGAVGFREWAILEPLASKLMTEIVSTEDSVRLPGYNALNKCWLASCMLVLKDFHNHLCPAVSSYSWAMLPSHQESKSKAFREQVRKEGVRKAVYSPRHSLPPFKGGLLDYHVRLLTPDKVKTKKFTSDDALWMETYFRKFNELAASSEQFRFALEASVDWRYSKEERSAIARLWSGIEAIFDVKSELSFRIPLYASAAVEERGEKRLAAFSKFRKLYNVRSKAVHGESLESSQLKFGINDSFSLLRDLIIKSVTLGEIPTNEHYINELLS